MKEAKPRIREVKEEREVAAILARCTTVRIGMTDGERPYIMPVSFGLDLVVA